MRYPFRAGRVDGRIVGALVGVDGRLESTYFARAYFAEARRPEILVQGNLADALPEWIEPSVRATGAVSLDEIQLTDDLPEIRAGDYSPSALAAWLTVRNCCRALLTQRVDAERACAKKGFALFFLRVSGLSRAIFRFLSRIFQRG